MWSVHFSCLFAMGCTFVFPLTLVPELYLGGSDAAETGQLFGIVEAGKPMGIDQDPSGRHKSDRAYRDDILKGGG